MRLVQTDEIYGFEGSAWYNDPHVVMSEYLLIFATLIVASVVVQHLIEKSHNIKRYLPEAAATMLLGMLLGLCIRLAGGYDINWTTTIAQDDGGSSTNSIVMGSSNNKAAAQREATVLFDPYLLGFNPQVFFFGFLPPIIFNSGFHLKRRLFYQNFGGIFCLAILGTCISIAIVSSGLYLLSRGIAPLVSSASSLSMIECVCFASLISSTGKYCTSS
jgi:NhaP-type Na+/H+ or K+/H+ antiporter